MYGVGSNLEERDDNSISDGFCFAGGFCDRRRRRSGSPRRGRRAAYVVTEVGISDLDAYQKEYVPLAQAAIKASGGRLVAAGQNIVVFDGPSPGTRVAINAFDSLDAVQAWRNSDQFKEARKVGDKYAKFRSFAIEGLPSINPATPAISRGSLNEVRRNVVQSARPLPGACAALVVLAEVARQHVLLRMAARAGLAPFEFRLANGRTINNA